MNSNTKTDKRDVILEFYSSPDAILNALHQAGWKIVPKQQAQLVPISKVEELLQELADTTEQRDELLAACKTIRDKYWANYGTPSEFTICIGSFHGKDIPKYWRKLDAAIKRTEDNQ